MSQSGLFGSRGRQAMPTLPEGETVARFTSYPEAQKAVDTLARADFPVTQVAIVGDDLVSVERVTGKLTWGRVALAGAASGAWLGIFFGLLLMIFSDPEKVTFGLLIAAILIGAGFGMFFGLVSYAINRRRRDFTSTMQVIASQYALVVEPSLAGRARNLLGSSANDDAAGDRSRWRAPDAAERVHTTAADHEPPKYGERIDSAQPRTYGEQVDAQRAERPKPQFGEYAPSSDETGAAGEPSTGESSSSGEETDSANSADSTDSESRDDS